MQNLGTEFQNFGQASRKTESPTLFWWKAQHEPEYQLSANVAGRRRDRSADLNAMFINHQTDYTLNSLFHGLPV